MTFEQMKQLEPELLRLADSARFAGANGASWLATWMAMVEPLSKVVGHGGTDERLRSDHCYTAARWSIHMAWRRGQSEAGGDQATPGSRVLSRGAARGFPPPPTVALTHSF